VTFAIEPGDRFVFDGFPLPSFPDDAFGRLRARLVFAADTEAERLHTTTDHVGVLASNPIDLDQIAPPLALDLEQLAPVVVGADLDPNQIFRVTARNRSATDVMLHGPGGITAGVGFELYEPNGGVWPKGDRPVMHLAPEPSHELMLHPGDTIEIFGPHAALGVTPGTWNYPVAETFRIRAMLSQPNGPFLYSNWLEIRAR
jgi:hypothetical protein